jgi:multiple sugar transport system ATP-binding protein
MTDVQLDSLTKVFDEGNSEVVAVEDIDITVEDGEFLVLVGPSGCGKSTTLRCIAGLETVTEGAILLGDRDITYEKPKDRDIAMVFQNYALYPQRTARGNMSFGLEMTTDLSEAEIDQRVEDAAEMMGITDLLHQKPGELSGGQQQRVALGRAIVRDPEVFLMDEPLSNLDAKLRGEMRTELQNLQQELGVTTIYVTHDQTEAMTMGDRIAVLNRGELQQIGTPIECYDEPANRFVAGFIGSPSMNFFEVEQTSERTLEHGAFSYQISSQTADALSGESDALTLGIRPEDIEVVPAESDYTFEAQVDVVEQLGDSTYAYVELAQNTYTVTMPRNRRLSSGDNIALRFPEEFVHVFDRDTGIAIKNASLEERGQEDLRF